LTIGLRVLDVDGQEIGEVIRVQNFGAGDLLEIRMNERKQAPFVPFTREAVPVVDLVEGYVQLGPNDVTGL
jgi:RimM protein, required for 16S rRNA processing